MEDDDDDLVDDERADEVESKIICSICIENALDGGEAVLPFECGHLVHKDCAEKWKKTCERAVPRRPFSCASCRKIEVAKLAPPLPPEPSTSTTRVATEGRGRPVVARPTGLPRPPPPPPPGFSLSPYSTPSSSSSSSSGRKRRRVDVVVEREIATLTEALARLEESKKRANVVCSERVEFARREKKAVVARIDAEKAMIRGKMKRLRES